MADTNAALINKPIISTVQTSEVDLIGEILDNCRSWQLRTILIIYLTKIPTAFFMACIVYTAPVPQRVHVYCKNISITDTQGSLSSFTKIMHPPIISVYDKEFDLSYCDTFADVEDHARIYYKNRKYEVPWIAPNISQANVHDNLNRIPCDLFNFKSGKSVTTYDIVCSRGGLVVLTQGMHLVGIFLSGIVARYLMKITSPKTVMQITMIAQIICGTIAGLATSLTSHLIFRALSAIGCAAAFGSGTVIFSDITRGKLKIAALLFFDIFWSIGIIILSIITEYESRWSELYVVISYPTLIIILLSVWIPDSPRWLISHGEVEKTHKILKDAAKYCRSNLPANLKLKLQNLILLQEPPPARWLNLWQESCKTTIQLVALHTAFGCFTIMYFGMVLNMPNYGRDYLASSAKFIALSEMIGCSMGFLFATKTKYKFLWSGIFNILGASVAFCMWFWTNREAEFVEKGHLLYFCLILKASVSCSFGILFACSTDLVKKQKKAILMFSAILCGRLFLLNAPVIVSLGTLYGEYLSLTLFAATGVIGGMSMIVIDMSLRFNS